ncbi:MAG: SpoIVB peptidase [Clostridia bacterium]|nr:SpoIVB peptidase [Clostridia bacterium]
MKKIIKIICVIMILLCSVLMGTATAGYLLLPDTYTTVAGTSAGSGRLFTVGAAERAVMANGGDTYNGELQLLGAVPIKTVRVAVKERQTVTVCGSIFGLRLFTEGVNVVDTDTVQTAQGEKKPALAAGLMKGDIITAVNGNKIMDITDISNAVDDCNGGDIAFTVRRAGNEYVFSVTPEIDRDTGGYKVGLWLRDNAAGIGTLTFYEPETRVFAGLGHAVCDADTGLPVEMSYGEVLSAHINSVKKGSSGFAGEISGTFEENLLGGIYLNTDSGIFGALDAAPVTYGDYEIALPSEITEGEAEVVTSIDNDGPKAYSLEITEVNPTADNHRDMVIRVTDTRLLAATGGIVQGMSGSPILQNGKLIGAVTHVLLDDSATGYAIFADTMWDTASSLADAEKAA